jgi:hypothetical protein
MSRTATYHTTVRWTGDHWGHIEMGNGPEMKFSAPPDAQDWLASLRPRRRAKDGAQNQQQPRQHQRHRGPRKTEY